jgi:myo-inositol-1(or 4)-monophosphatase
MEPVEQRKALAAAVNAARAVGELMRANLRAAKTVNLSTQHDIKLELDVRSQKLIEEKLSAAFPDIALLGEEGVAGDANAERRWVVDPIDGTVNFTYGIPHACVSIALQAKSPESGVQRPGSSRRSTSRRLPRAARRLTLLGVVYDPFADELWTAIRGQAARLNGRVIHVSRRRKLSEAIVSMGFAKSKATIEETLPCFNQLVRRVRKVRIMGSAALALTYVATGRFDAYLERGISLWDIAAGGLIVECAGGEFWREPIAGEHRYQMIASNGFLRRRLRGLR